MTYKEFDDKWEARFATNDQFLIGAADLREFKDDLLLTFGVSVANVPTYVAGTRYTEGFLVRYSQAGGRESFYYALQAGLLPHPTYNQTDANWKVVPGPVPETLLSQLITLAEAQGIDGNGVVRGRRYGILGKWNGSQVEELVEVDGLENVFRPRATLVRADGTLPEVDINVQAATYVVAASGGSALPRTFPLTSTSSNPFADMLLDQSTARLAWAVALFNAAGVMAQVLLLDGTAYRPARSSVNDFNDDLVAFWAEYGAGTPTLCRFRSVAASQGSVSHTTLIFTLPPSSSPQYLHGHDSLFRPFGNQFVLYPPDWNYATSCTISGGSISANNDFGQSYATSSPLLSNTGTGLRIRVEFVHNGSPDYGTIGLSNTPGTPSYDGGNFGPCFYRAGNNIHARIGTVAKSGSLFYTGQLAAIELHDLKGVSWFLDGVEVANDPVVPAGAAYWLAVAFYNKFSGYFDVQVGAQTTTPR